MEKIEKLVQHIKKQKMKSRIEKNLSLSSLTTAGVGGKCLLFIAVSDEKELLAIMKEIYAKKIRFKIVGRGSNLLFKDAGFQGVVLQLSGKDFQDVRLVKGGIYAGAYVTAKKLLNFCLKNKRGGMEFLTGIPGTMGGMLRMNAGAFSKSLGAYVKKVEVLIPSCRKVFLCSQDLQFSYREVKGVCSQSVILSLILKSRKCETKRIQGKIKFYSSKREKKQPSGKTFGSVFKNPSEMKAWEVVDKLGLRGFSSGGASISREHANWIVNKNFSRSRDMLKIIRKVQKEADKKLGIKLETEVEII